MLFFSCKLYPWIIVRKYVICNKDKKVREYLMQNVSWSQYERIPLDYPDLPFENRESPQEHRYRTDTDEDRVVIYIEREDDRGG
jgi:hypothetical protein